MTDIHKITLDDRITNKSGVARFFEVTPKTVDSWIRDGMPVIQRGPRGKSWQIDLLEVARWRFASRLTPGGLDPETLPPGERKLWYDGETRRRELQVRDGKLLDAAETAERISTSFNAIAQTMWSLPDNLERTAGLTPEQAEAVEKTVHGAMTDLAERLQELARDPGTDDDDQ